MQNSVACCRTPTCQRHTLPPGRPLQWRISSNMQESKIKTDRQLYRGAVLVSGWEGSITNQPPSSPTITTFSVCRHQSLHEYSFHSEGRGKKTLPINHTSVTSMAALESWQTAQQLPLKKKWKKNRHVDRMLICNQCRQARLLLWPAFNSRRLLQC